MVFAWFREDQFFLFFFKEVFRAKAPSRVQRLTPASCLHMKLFTCSKTCLQIRLSLKSLVLIWVGTNFFSNFQKPSSFWVPVKSRWHPTFFVNCILLCETELNFNLCKRAWLLHARLPSACIRVWAFFTTAWKKPVCCTSCTLSVGGREPGAKATSGKSFNKTLPFSLRSKHPAILRWHKK